MVYRSEINTIDHYEQLQYCINECLRLKERKLIIPSGTYFLSKGLSIGDGLKQVTLKIDGESFMWGAGGTILKYLQTSGSAFSVNLGKGVEISNITLQGSYFPPLFNDTFYIHTALTYENPLNISKTKGFVIDELMPYGKGGSTCIYLHDCQIMNFETMIEVSPNKSQNGDIIQLDRIQLANGKYGIKGNQTQEKGNIVNNITSWGNLYCLFTSGNKGSGQWTFNGGNIAGHCVQGFDIDQGGSYPTTINGMFFEGLGRIGKLWSHVGIPLNVNNNIFHIAPNTSEIVLDVIGMNVKGEGNIIRYFGTNNPIKIKSADKQLRINGYIPKIEFV